MSVRETARIRSGFPLASANGRTRLGYAVLALTLLLLVSLTLMELNRARHAADTVARSSVLAGAYPAVAEGIAVEAVLVHRHRNSPDPVNRAAYQQRGLGGKPREDAGGRVWQRVAAGIVDRDVPACQGGRDATRQLTPQYGVIETAAKTPFRNQLSIRARERNCTCGAFSLSNTLSWFRRNDNRRL